MSITLIVHLIYVVPTYCAFTFVPTFSRHFCKKNQKLYGQDGLLENKVRTMPRNVSMLFLVTQDLYFSV